MTQNLNQFAITPEAGDAVFSPVEPLDVLVASGVASDIAAGTFVKVSATAAKGDAIVVEPCAATDTAYLGVVKRDIRSMPAKANGRIGVFTFGAIVWIKAGAAAINAGDKVELTTTGVKKAAATNNTVGICLNEVAANGLAMVQLTPSLAYQA